jgi:hypothetical protein
MAICFYGLKLSNPAPKVVNIFQLAKYFVTDNGRPAFPVHFPRREMINPEIMVIRYDFTFL